MKYMIASDIHGSAFYCRQMLQQFEREKADSLILLGDLLYHGARNDLPKEYAPKEVTAMLNEKRKHLFCVKGNCDSEVDQMVMEFPIMADYMLMHEMGRMIFVTHGHHYHLNAMPQLRQGDILLYGHTHVPACLEQNGMIYMNPGSISIPKENSERSYMILENGVFHWKVLKSGEVYQTYKICVDNL